MWFSRLFLTQIRTSSSCLEDRVFHAPPNDTVTELNKNLLNSMPSCQLDAGSIRSWADPNSVRPDTRPIGRYIERISGWDSRHPLGAPNRTQVGQAEMYAIPDPGSAFKVGRVTVGGRVARRNGRSVN
jgi:hypothetical protein